MADIQIAFPAPREMMAPKPERLGAVHQYYYTGERTKPIFYKGRALWKVRYRYGVQSNKTRRDIELLDALLLRTGQGIIPLYFPFDGHSYSNSVSFTVDYNAGTIQFSSSVANALDIKYPIQLGRYCLSPISRPTNTKIQFSNLPESGLGSSGRIIQGRGVYNILARKDTIEPVVTHVLSSHPPPGAARIEDITFTEVP